MMCSTKIHIRFSTFWVALLAFWTMSASVSGEELLMLVHQAKFEPPTSFEIESARSDAISAVGSVEAYLRQHDPSGQWRAYLLLDEIYASLSDLSTTLPANHSLDVDRVNGETFADESEAPSVDHLASLRATLGRSIGDHPGQETPAILEMRRRLQRLIQLLKISSGPAVETEFENKRRVLLEKLGLPESFRDQDWFREVMSLVSWFDEVGQASRVVDLAVKRWSNPNLEAQISAKALEIVTRREVHETEPIRECKDGRWITGSALATGVARMVPQATAPAECRIVFDGNIHSTMGGAEGPVSFQLAGVTDLHVEQPVLFAQHSFTVLSPLPVASTRLWTDRVTTKREGALSPLIRKIATKKIAEEHPEARRSLNRKSRDKFVKKFNEDVICEISEAFQDLQDDLFAPLNRLDVCPDDFHFVSSGDCLQTRMTVNGGFGLGAPTVAPPLSPNANFGDFPHPDLAISIHESVVNRLAQRMLAGETFSNPAKIASQFEFKLTNDQLAELPSDVGVTFTDDNPVEVRFENDIVELNVQGQRYQVGSAILVGMKARIRYRISVRGGDLWFTLDGPPQVFPLSQQGSARFYLQKNVLEKHLAEELPKVKSVDGFDLPEPANRLGRASYFSATAREGWLQIELMGER